MEFDTEQVVLDKLLAGGGQGGRNPILINMGKESIVGAILQPLNEFLDGILRRRIQGHCR